MINYYNVRPWQTYVDYLGYVYIVTEKDHSNVVLVDEDGVVFRLKLMDFINECMGNRFKKIKRCTNTTPSY